MPVMLIAIGAADGIHILNKYYEEAAKRQEDPDYSRRDIVINTMDEMFAPVVMTSLTTAAGFLGLITAFLWPQRMMGVFTALGILYAMALSFTLIPALLARLKVPEVKGNYRRSPLSMALGRVATVVGGRPGWTVGVAAAVLIVFAIGVSQVRVETSSDAFLGEGHPVVRAMDTMEEHFGGSRQMAIDIRTGKRDGLKDPEVLRKIVDLHAYLEANIPEVGQISSVADVVRQLNETLHASNPEYYRIPDDPRLAAQLFILFGGDPGKLFLGDYSQGEVLTRLEDVSSRRYQEIVAQVQSYLDREFGDAEVAQAEMVGIVRAFSVLTDKVVSSQITSLSASVVAAGILVAVLMMSLTAGLLGLIPLVLTIVIEFGAMSYAGIPLDMATLMLGSIAVGIGIDYVIHFLSRFRLESQAGYEPAEAFERTMRSAGKGITYNALALVLGFAVLTVSTFQGLVNFGLLIVLTMAVASISAFTVVPAILVLRRPGFLRASSPFIQPETAEPASD
jgi:predicted RND superfamily exporter protein